MGCIDLGPQEAAGDQILFPRARRPSQCFVSQNGLQLGAAAKIWKGMSDEEKLPYAAESKCTFDRQREAAGLAVRGDGSREEPGLPKGTYGVVYKATDRRTGVIVHCTRVRVHARTPEKRQSRKAAMERSSRKAAKPPWNAQAAKPQGRKAAKPQSRHGTLKPQSRKAAKPPWNAQAAKPQSRKAAMERSSRKAAKPQSRKAAMERSSRKAAKPPWPQALRLMRCLLRSSPLRCHRHGTLKPQIRKAASSETHAPSHVFIAAEGTRAHPGKRQSRKAAMERPSRKAAKPPSRHGTLKPQSRKAAMER